MRIMNKLIHGLIAAVFGITCLWLSWMLTLILDFTGETNAQLPGLTRFCLSLRPLLLVLPVLALGYCVYVWFSKNDARKSWVGFFAGTMMVLVFVMVPTIIAAWLPLPHLVKSILVVRSN